MNVKGFILEDDQGREFVMGCEQPHAQRERTFLLRGWQRRRMIPLPYSERETRHFAREALLALNDLFGALLKRCHDQTITARFAEKAPEVSRSPLKIAPRGKG